MKYLIILAAISIASAAGVVGPEIVENKNSNIPVETIEFEKPLIINPSKPM